VTRLAENQTPDCPPATQDIQLNLENRQNAIDNVGYGPLNPAEPNEEFWQDKAERWNIEIQEAKTALCGNCIFFIRTPKMLDCIKEGIGLGNEEAQGSVEAGELGYCNALDFKCASERTCNAWAAGGPVTEDSNEDTATVTAAAKKKRTISQTPAPKKDRIKGSSKNKKGSASGSKSARKVVFSKSVENSLKEKVSKHNEKASKGRKTTLGTLKAVYRRGAGAFSTSHRPGMNRNQWALARVNAFLKLLKSGKPSNSAYTQDNDLLPVAHPRSSKKSNSAITASGLVPEERDFANALLAVVEKHGKFDEDGTGVWAGYTPAAENEDAKIGVICKNCVFYQDTEGGDVCKIISLPIEDLGKCRLAVIPDGLVDIDAAKNYMEERKELPDLIEEFYIENELSVEIKDQDSYENPEEALVVMAEYSQMGYEMITPLRASWLRAVEAGENPFERAAELSTLAYESKDADLLPRKLEGTF
jgi:hypothetical protein